MPVDWSQATREEIIAKYQELTGGEVTPIDDSTGYYGNPLPPGWYTSIEDYAKRLKAEGRPWNKQAYIDALATKGISPDAAGTMYDRASAFYAVNGRWPGEEDVNQWLGELQPGLGQTPTLGREESEFQRGTVFPYEQERFRQQFGENQRQYNIGQENWGRQFGENQRQYNVGATGYMPDAQGGQTKTLDRERQEASIAAEQERLRQSNASMLGYLNSPDGKQLPTLERQRIEAEIRQNDRRLQQAEQAQSGWMGEPGSNPTLERERMYGDLFARLSGPQDYFQSLIAQANMPAGSLGSLADVFARQPAFGAMYPTPSWESKFADLWAQNGVPQGTAPGQMPPQLDLQQRLWDLSRAQPGMPTPPPAAPPPQGGGGGGVAADHWRQALANGAEVQTAPNGWQSIELGEPGNSPQGGQPWPWQAGEGQQQGRRLLGPPSQAGGMSPAYPSQRATQPQMRQMPLQGPLSWLRQPTAADRAYNDAYNQAEGARTGQTTEMFRHAPRGWSPGMAVTTRGLPSSQDLWQATRQPQAGQNPYAAQQQGQGQNSVLGALGPVTQPTQITPRMLANMTPGMRQLQESQWRAAGMDPEMAWKRTEAALPKGSANTRTRWGSWA